MKYIAVCLSIFMIGACNERNNDLNRKSMDSLEVEGNEAIKDSLETHEEIALVQSQQD